MAFHIDTYNIPPIRNYSDAKQYWSRIKPWRGAGDMNARPIAGRNKKHMIMRMTNDESIAFRLHGTDVVVYHPDGTITLNAYPSVSTDMFARSLTPSGISTSFNNGAGYLLHLERGDTTMTFRMARESVRLMRHELLGWLPTDPAMFAPFVKYRVNTTKANDELKRYKFKDFQAWIKARAALVSTRMGIGYLRDPKYCTDYGSVLADFLAMEEGGWERLFEEYHDRADEAVRNAIYKIENCIIKIEVPSVAGYNVSTITASANKWRRLANQF